MDRIAGLAGNLEPLAQRYNDGRGDSDEGRSVTLDLRIGCLPRAHGTDTGAAERGKEPC